MNTKYKTVATCGITNFNHELKAAVQAGYTPDGTLVVTSLETPLPGHPKVLFSQMMKK